MCLLPASAASVGEVVAALPQSIPSHSTERVRGNAEGANENDVPPYFKTEPVRSQLHLERNRLVLTCMAEGSWPLEFKWIHNSTELTRFSLEYRWVPTEITLSAPCGFRTAELMQRRSHSHEEEVSESHLSLMKFGIETKFGFSVS
ncbi:putative protein sidekick-2 [Scophthalmus maximus]|uniref:Ig-like domain-containing protein n=1 Tax=Scophthalmus maximus TaxID=52904 RepID=A0A2U9CN07_SCOMX|nr:putative protein sidekick-2 [Scophthalmus maximus]